MVDLRAQVAALRPELDAAVAAVLDSGAFVRGPFVRDFEAELAAYVEDVGTAPAHALGVGNGTDALQIALMALGVGPGDEVVCPAFTFVATAEAAALLGARPVFADIDPATFNLDPERVADAVTSRTKAVVPVHLFGQMADLDAIRAAAGGVPIVEDAAQALGATRDGRAAGTVGAIGTLSFYPSKNLGAFGDGGAILTTDADLADRVRAIANHGAERKYHHTRVGVNSRLDAIQAAILSAQLRHLPAWTDARRAAAALYDAHLAGLDDVVRPRPGFGRAPRVPPVHGPRAGRPPRRAPRPPPRAGRADDGLLPRAAPPDAPLRGRTGGRGGGPARDRPGVRRGPLAPHAPRT